jgi:hypothetical protein
VRWLDSARMLAPLTWRKNLPSSLTMRVARGPYAEYRDALARTGARHAAACQSVAGHSNSGLR